MTQQQLSPEQTAIVVEAHQALQRLAEALVAQPRALDVLVAELQRRGAKITLEAPS